MRHIERPKQKSAYSQPAAVVRTASRRPDRANLAARIELPEHATAVALRQPALRGLQRTCGNRAVVQKMAARAQRSCPPCEEEIQRKEAADQVDVVPAIQYNTSRQFASAAVDVIQAEVGAPPTGVFDPTTVHAIAGWQGDSARRRKLEPDGKMGPKSLGSLIADVTAQGQIAEARILAGYSHQLPPGAVGIPAEGESSAESGDSCTGKSKQGPGTFTVIRDFSTVKAYEIGNFDIARYFLKPEHKTRLEEQLLDDDIIRLVKEEGWSVQILGGASTTGSDAYNMALSELRAICTQLFLLDQGMPAGTMKHGGGGEHAARERLKTEGAPAIDNVEAAVDRRVQIWVIKGKGPEPDKPEEPADPCPKEEVLCHMWWQLADPCSLLILSEIFTTDLACTGLNPLVCLVLEAGGTVSEDLKELAGACCSIENPAKTGEGVAELLENCMIGFMKPKIPEHFGECDELEDEETLRDSLRSCMKKGDPRGK
jgi:outer membrane protein OmpA-like peptidoglycan-associated protein